MNIFVLILILLLLFGGGGFYGWNAGHFNGVYLGGGLGLLVLIVVLLLFMGRV